MAELHVYGNDYEWVIATSPEDALAVWFEHTGEKPEDYMDADIDFDQEPDDKVHKVWCEEGSDTPGEIGCGHLVEKTNREWAELLGRGYFCTTEC